ncbi:MAG: Homoserine/homoserine lactone efflux protein [Paracidovorax wautersii]|uniref:Homoserine/homoserine lactone efflux protein n=1 Tax=Paracidovorax wautersii TaxID=1177982 RepID=A0A7V8FLV1_9BURK|nr:MAG: Homoserine/homoserine lactone efflux protein [Paracidovorax wautersii]
MSLHDFLLFLPACFALNLSFGPNNLLSVTYGARYGVPVAMNAGLGRLAAFVIMITISGLGMGTLLLASETAFTVVKYLGAAYLIWLGVKLLRAKAPSADLPLSQHTGEAAPSTRLLVRQEFMVAIGNPKAILIFTAFLPQFAVPHNYTMSYVQIGITFLLLEWATIGLYGWLGRRMGRYTRRAGAMRWFNRASGSLMVFFGLVLALARRPN